MYSHAIPSNDEQVFVVGAGGSPHRPGLRGGELVKAGHEVELIDSTGEAIDQFIEIDPQVLSRGLTLGQIIDRFRPATSLA